MNINALRDVDNDAGFYAAACLADPDKSWRGASLYVSVDAGASYTFVASFTRESVLGTTTNVLGDFSSGNITDEANSVNVRLLQGEFASVTSAGLLAGTFCVVIGDEILFVRDAVQEIDETWTLSGFLRGRRGSEYAMASHAVGDRVVLVDFATLLRVTQTTADIGPAKLYKAVTAGSTLAATTERTFTNEGAGLECYAPVHLGGGRDASNNLTINWIRRNRISGEWRDSVDVPMSEAVESYEVDICSDGTYTTVVNTLTSSVQTVAYSAASQTGDGLTPGATVYFKVYQLSAIVGRGYAATGSV